MKILKNLNRDENTSYWDHFAEERFFQQINGIDESFDNVLSPAILDEIPMNSRNIILDVGCGAGVLTDKLQKSAFSVDGIDGSEKCISIAKKNYEKNGKIFFYHSYIEDFQTEKRYDFAVANMVLMDLIDLQGAVRNIFNLLKDDGVFIFTITHPCFWHSYWKYTNEEWFDYLREIAIERDFDITNEKTSFKTAHIHRPLQYYICVLNRNSFYVEKMVELKGKGFCLPRFILFRCKKIR